ncbi:hypothetical protein VARIO8X_150056 [Burkholderiales bacterium 8X]|nr:hypothetical protein VARIO8X_150056 [Burkholderiales bacterium 8X]
MKSRCYTGINTKQLLARLNIRVLNLQAQ